uniref:Rpl22 n=1 Tax=Arundo donax TaxID=35708 RepID=A0A0A9EJZ1_ARUDO
MGMMRIELTFFSCNRQDMNLIGVEIKYS